MTVAELLLNDAKRLRSEDLGFDIPVTAEAVGGYGLISQILSLHGEDDGITTDGRANILGKLEQIRDAAKMSHLILFDTAPEKVKAYEDALEKITSM